MSFSVTGFQKCSSALEVDETGLEKICESAEEVLAWLLKAIYFTTCPSSLLTSLQEGTKLIFETMGKDQDNYEITPAWDNCARILHFILNTFWLTNFFSYPNYEKKSVFFSQPLLAWKPTLLSSKCLSLSFAEEARWIRLWRVYGQMNSFPLD